MKPSDILAVVGKLETAEDSFENAFGAVEQQWTDAARRQFEEDYLDTMEPNVRKMLDEIGRLATVLANANHECSSEYQ